MILRGLLSFETSSWTEWAPWTFVPIREMSSVQIYIIEKLTFRLVSKEMINFAGSTIVCDNGETLVVHVQDQILAL